MMTRLDLAIPKRVVHYRHLFASLILWLRIKEGKFKNNILMLQNSMSF